MTEDEYRQAQLERETRRDTVELELNRDRQALERARFQRENRFLNRHLAAIISLLAVIVTATQLWFGIKKDERDRAAQQVRDERESETKDIESGVLISRVLIERQSDVFAADALQRERTRAAILVDLPPGADSKVRAYFDRVALRALPPPETAVAAKLAPLRFKVDSVDDRIRVRLNGMPVYEGGATPNWQTAVPSPGTNIVEVEVFNQASYTGGIEVFGGHKREGWNYSITFETDGVSARTFSDRRDEPPIEQFGAWFLVQKLRLTVDPATGKINPANFLQP